MMAWAGSRNASSRYRHTRVQPMGIGSPLHFVVGFLVLVILPLTTLILYEIFKKKARGL